MSVPITRPLPHLRGQKRGFTLIELMCTLAVVSMAVLFGAQLFTLGARAYANSKTLETNTMRIIEAYETGLLPPDETADGKALVKTEKADALLSFSLSRAGAGTIDLLLPVTRCTLTVRDEAGKTQTSLCVLEGSLPR